jgi:putative endopeptidase
MVRTQRSLFLSLAATAVLAGCKGSAADNAARSATALKLDERTLPPVLRFAASDLDSTRNACTDFGGYVNGKWVAAATIPSDLPTWGSFLMLHERSLAVQRQLAEQVASQPKATGVAKIIGDFWATGMDTAHINAQGLEPLASRLAAIDALTDGPAIAEFVRQSAARGENVLFGFGSDPDFKNSAMMIGYAMQGGLGLPDRRYYFDNDKRKELAAYQAHAARVLELSGIPAADAATQARQVVALETRLARVSKSNEELARDASLYYHPVALAEADRLTPNFPWTRFFEAQGVAVPEMFSLAIPAFHQEVSKALGDTDPAIWRDYLRFRTIDRNSRYLSEPFVQERYEFYDKTLTGQREIEPRWKQVLGTIERSSGEALGQLYVQVAFTPDAKARMETLVRHLNDALKVRIESLTWMSAETKAKALAKWAAFTPKIGYPDKWREWDGLQTGRESYLANVLAAREFNYRWELSKIGKPVDRTEWGMTPQTVNAYYSPQRNEIVFPAAILQPPFFDPAADDAINYGAIGAVIGHEMTHGYDDQGARFGPSGNFENWWADADARNFKALTGKLVAQFNGYEVGPGARVNGNLTLGENIADLGGLATAHDAMKAATAGQADPMVDGLTRDQRFFLSWATAWRSKHTPEYQKMLLNVDSHAPDQIRAIGAPSNLPAFAAAFGCKAGDPMARSGAQQVVIW